VKAFRLEAAFANNLAFKIEHSTFEEFKTEFMAAKSSDSFFTEIAEKYPYYRNVLTDYISCLEVEEQKYARIAKEAAEEANKIAEAKKRKYELEVETANMDVKIAEHKKRTKEFDEEAAKDIAKIAEQKRRKYAVESELRELYEKEIQKHRLEIEENFQNQFGAKGSALLDKISQISVAIFSPHYSQEQLEIFYNSNVKKFEKFLNLDQFKKLFEKKLS
jgi:predicted RND superfamily exporter protein